VNSLPCVAQGSRISEKGGEKGGVPNRTGGEQARERKKQWLRKSSYRRFDFQRRQNAMPDGFVLKGGADRVS